MKIRWSFSIWMLVVYVLTFAIWKVAPSRASFLVVGVVAVTALSYGILRVHRTGYFHDRVDLMLHIWVIVDLALESAAFEALRWMQPLAVLETFHDNFHFVGCAVVLSALVGGYRWHSFHKK